MKYLGYFMYIGGMLSLTLMHFYTVYCVFDIFGIGWSLVAFLTPPFSELILAGISIKAFGLFNSYFVLLIVFGMIYTIGQNVLARCKI